MKVAFRSVWNRRRRRGAASKGARKRPLHSLRLEPLEDRRLLALVSIDDQSVTEPDQGQTTPMDFTVTLDLTTLPPNPAVPVIVNWSTANDTATAGQDYNGASGPAIQFSPPFQVGVNQTRLLRITILGDNDAEPPGFETFHVNLTSATNATIADAIGVGTIIDDDGPVGSLAIDDVSVTEGNSGPVTARFTVTRSGSTAGTCSANWATANDTAMANGDYLSASGTVTFSDGQATKFIDITVNGDTEDEFDERFFVDLSSPTNCTISDARGIGTILDDDGPVLPVVTIVATDANAAEPTGGSTNPGEFTVTRTGSTGAPLSVSYLVTGTATNGVDYVLLSGSVTIGIGNASQTIPVTPFDDVLLENSETVVATLQTSANYDRGTPLTATVTIVDNDNDYLFSATEDTKHDQLVDCGCTSDPLMGGVRTAFHLGDGISLLYNSLTHPSPIVMVENHLTTTASLIPTAMTATLRRVSDSAILGVETHNNPGNILGLTPDNPLRFTFQFDASAWDTGRYPLELELVGTLSDGSIPADKRTRKYTFDEFVVNRVGNKASAPSERRSPFGDGWWISGLDQLETSQSATAGVTLVTADGRTFWFAKTADPNVFLRPEGEPDFSTLVKSGSNYTLTSKHGLKSVFNSAGLLTSRTDRNNNQTTVTWTGSPLRPSLITDPFGRKTHLGYSGNLLDTVFEENVADTTDPLTLADNRASKILRSGNQVVGILPHDPDTSGTSTIGLFDPATANYSLRNENNAGLVETSFAFGPTGSTWKPIVGQWGDLAPLGPPTSTVPWNDTLQAEDTVGFYDALGGTFYLRRVNAMGTTDLSFPFGPTATNWIAIVGDWDADGDDSIGLYNPTNGTFYLKNVNSAGDANHTFVFGPGGAGWLPVAGDWDGDGTDTIGLYDPAAGAFFLRNSHAGGAADHTFFFGPTNSGYKPLAGDWDDDLLSSVGLYAPVTAGFFLRNEHLGGVADYQFNFGPANAGRLPLAGDWDGLMTSVFYATSGNGVGQLSQVRSPVGRKSTVAYDQFKRLDSIAAPHPSTAGATVDTELDSLQSVAAAQTTPKRDGPRRGRSVDEKDNVTEFETDRFGSATLSIAPPNPTIKPETRWTRDANGLATQMILPDPVSGAPSATAIYASTFDSQGNRLRATNPDGSHADWTYGPFSLVATADDERGGTTTFLRDAKGNVTSAADDLGNATTFEIDAVRGWVKSVTTADPDGTGPGNPLLPAKTDFLRDTFGNVTTLKRPLLPGQNESSRNTVVWTYDGSDNVASSTDELGRRSDFLWDTLNRPVRTTGPDPDVLGSGQPAPVWRTQFNSVSEVVATWDPLVSVTRANYGPAGLVSRIRLPDPATGKTTAGSPTESFTYDAAGLPATAVDPLGRITQFTFDAWGLIDLVQSPDPDGGGPLPAPFVDYVRDQRGRVSSVKTTDPDGAGGLPQPETAYVRNDRDFVTNVILPDPDGPSGGLLSPTLAFTHYATGEILTQTDPRGAVTTRIVDTLGRLDRLKLPNPADGQPTGPEWDFNYDALSRMTEELDPLLHATRHEFDAWNRETKTIDAKNNAWLTSYDAASQIDVLTGPDPDGGGPRHAAKIDYDYNNLGLVTTIKPPDPLTGLPSLAHAVKYEHDLVGNTTRIVQPNPSGGGGEGPATSFTLDRLYRVTHVTSPTGTAQNVYDIASQVSESIDELGRRTAYQRDGLGRATTIVTPDPVTGLATGPAWQVFFDAASRIKEEKDPAGKSTVHTFDNLNRRLTTTDAKGGITRFTWDAASNLEKLLDPMNNETTLAYDFLNRMTSEDNGPDPARTWAYNAASVVTQYTDRLGRVTEFVPDELNRIVEERWKQGATTVNTIASAFDSAGLLTSISDVYSAYGFGYDDAGRNTSVSNAGTPGAPTVVLTSGFDNMSRRTSLKANVNGTNDFQNLYTWDTGSRVTRIDQTQQSGGAQVAEKRVDLGWDAVSNLATVTRYKDTDGGTTNEVAKTTYTRDKLDRLTDLLHQKGTNPAIATYHWNYDNVSRVVSMFGPDGSINYGYDFTHQLTTVDVQGTTVGDENFGYDNAGNRNTAGYTTGANNRITSDGTFSYLHDAEGNRIRRTRISSAPADDFKVEYEYDHRNRLTKVTLKNNADVITKVVVYRYDAFNQRIARWEDSTSPFDLNDAVIEHFVMDGPDVVLDFLDADGPAGAAPTLAKRYLHGPLVDQIFGQEDVLKTLTDPERVLWHLADNLGSTRDLVNQNGAVVTNGHYKFESFGKRTAGDETKTRYLYAGRELDPDTGLYYNRNRWYDPGVGEFTNEDPIGFGSGDYNLPRYAGNSPTNATDPYGLVATDFDMVVFDLELWYQDPEVHKYWNRDFGMGHLKRENTTGFFGWFWDDEDAWMEAETPVVWISDTYTEAEAVRVVIERVRARLSGSALDHDFDNEAILDAPESEDKQAAIQKERFQQACSESAQLSKIYVKGLVSWSGGGTIAVVLFDVTEGEVDAGTALAVIPYIGPTVTKLGIGVADGAPIYLTGSQLETLHGLDSARRVSLARQLGKASSADDALRIIDDFGNIAPKTGAKSAGDFFEESVKSTFSKKIIRQNEVLRNSGGKVIGEIDFETAEAIVEVGISLRGKVDQLHRLAETAYQRAKRLDVIYGPDTSPGTLEFLKESLGKKWGNRVRFMPHE